MNTPTRMAVVVLVHLCVVLGLLPINAAATVIPNDAILSPGFSSPHDYVFELTLSTLGGGAYAVGIDILGGNDFHFSGFSISEDYSLHTVTYGAAFTPGYAANDSSPVVWMPPPYTDRTLNIPIDASIFLGYWDDRSGDHTPTSNDNYGWVELHNSSSGLNILDGATAIGGGIYAGTYTQIPEPNTIALLCLGAGAMMFRCRRKQK